jgi:hypothetical protein
LAVEDQQEDAVTGLHLLQNIATEVQRYVSAQSLTAERGRVDGWQLTEQLGAPATTTFST